MNIKQKIGGGLALGAMLASVIAPGAALASTNVNIAKNGAFSKNTVLSISASKNVVKQTNKTNVNSLINVQSNTGKNNSSFNVGGGNFILTGNTETVVAIETTGNTNTNTSDCGCEDSTTTVDIKDNGAFSKNNAAIFNINKNVVKQSNKTNVNTTVITTSNTGKNNSSFNVGGGSIITTGSTSTGVGISVNGGSNNN